MKNIRLLLGTLALTGLPFLMSGCQSDDFTTVDLAGRAIYPPQLATTLGEVVPARSVPFQVVDLGRAAGEDVVATGQTDQNGGYFVTVPRSNTHAVIVLGEVRVAGLIDDRNGSESKDFNGATDVACEAGITSVRDGSITDAELDATRIARLESAAADLLKTFAVDFTDADGSRSEAVRRVRALTGNGDHLPGE